MTTKNTLHPLFSSDHAGEPPDFNPVWDVDEYTYRCELQVALKRYYDRGNTLMCDVNFFDFLKLNQATEFSNDCDDNDAAFFSTDSRPLPSYEEKLRNKRARRRANNTRNGTEDSQMSSNSQVAISDTTRSNQSKMAPKFDETSATISTTNNSLNNPNMSAESHEASNSRDSLHVQGVSVESNGKFAEGFDEAKTRSPSSKNKEPMSPVVSSMRKRKRESQSDASKGSSSECSSPTDSEKRKRKRVATTGSSSDGQEECCIKGCDLSVTNRLRFSLRCASDDDFKNAFMDRGWHKICHRCYFRDLYQFKKKNKKKD